MQTASNLTAVMIVYRHKRINHRLRFGVPDFESRLDWRRKLVAFKPGRVFGYVRWRANQFGTQDWRLYVVRTVATGAITSLPGVIPGGEILFATHGSTRTRRALKLVDRLEEQAGSLENVSPSHWYYASNRINLNMDAHDYSAFQAMSFDENYS